MHTRYQHTTVSVTKGIGSAALGGLCGCALCVGEYGGKAEKALAPLETTCLEAVERNARVLDRSKGSIVVFVDEVGGHRPMSDRGLRLQLEAPPRESAT